MSDETKELNATCAEDGEEPIGARRRFLRQAACAAGLVLALPALSLAAEQDPEGEATKTAADLVLKTGEHQALSKVGGSEVVTTEAAGKIIVARTGESSFAACSAICTHKGAVLEYDHGSKKFVCPLHNSEFDLTGKVVGGPAKTNLKSYVSQAAAVVSLKPEA
jgi:Rieske Fe-S protein